MIIIAGHLRVAAADRDEYLTAVRDVAVQARRTAGCLDFVQSADPAELDRINVYERWQSDEALMSFRTGSGEATPPLPTPDIISADVAKYRISAVESP